MEKKLTLEQNYNEIIAVLKGERKPSPDLIEFCEGRIEQIHKKKGNGEPTEKQIENEKLKALILDALTDVGVTITDLCKTETLKGKDLSNQKVSRLTNDLVNDGKAEKIIEKGRSLFSLAKVVD